MNLLTLSPAGGDLGEGHTITALPRNLAAAGASWEVPALRERLLHSSPEASAAHRHSRPSRLPRARGGFRNLSDRIWECWVGGVGVCEGHVCCEPKSPPPPTPEPHSPRLLLPLGMQRPGQLLLFWKVLCGFSPTSSCFTRSFQTVFMLGFSFVVPRPLPG